MHKRIIGAATVLCLVLLLAVPVHAAGAGKKCTSAVGNKFMRGATNLLTGWVELISQTKKGYENGFLGYVDDKISGILSGMIAGVWYATGRTLSGAVDLAGFWAADPKDNEEIGIPLDAEYAWQEGEPYDFTDPNFAAATISPMGNKLTRGAQNALCGIAELPGQIAKGCKNRAPDAGISKGLWYFCSREIDGIGDLVGFAMPGPKDTKGVVFDEEYPWGALKESVGCKAAAKAEGVSKEKAKGKNLWKLNCKLNFKGTPREKAKGKDLWKLNCKLNFKGTPKKKAPPKAEAPKAEAAPRVKAEAPKAEDIK
jgi:putative exosortase-associated protein (TIGR04073 family)